MWTVVHSCALRIQSGLWQFQHVYVVQLQSPNTLQFLSLFSSSGSRKRPGGLRAASISSSSPVRDPCCISLPPHLLSTVCFLIKKCINFIKQQSTSNNGPSWSTLMLLNKRKIKFGVQWWEDGQSAVLQVADDSHHSWKDQMEKQQQTHFTGQTQLWKVVLNMTMKVWMQMYPRWASLKDQSYGGELSVLLRTALERLRPLWSALRLLLLLISRFFMFSCSSSWPASASAAMETGEGLSWWGTAPENFSVWEEKRKMRWWKRKRRKEGEDVRTELQIFKSFKGDIKGHVTG